MGLWRILGFLGLFLCISPFATAESRAAELRVAYDEELLTVSAQDVELGELLAVIAEEAGISVDSPENLDKSITIEFEQLSLEEGLNLILRDVNHVLFFSSAGRTAGQEIVSGVYIPEEEPMGRRPSRRTSRERIRREQEIEPEPREEPPPPVMEEFEELEEDPVLARYERELDQLEQQLERVEEDSPQGNAILSRIQRLEMDIERRLQELERQAYQ